MIDFIFTNLPLLIASLVGVGGWMFGTYKAKETKKSKAETILYRNIAHSHKKRAEMAEQLRDVIADDMVKMQKEANDEVKANIDTRSHFG